MRYRKATVLSGALIDWSNMNLIAVLVKLRRSLTTAWLSFSDDFESDFESGEDSSIGVLDGNLLSIHSCHL